MVLHRIVLPIAGLMAIVGVPEVVAAPSLRSARPAERANAPTARANAPTATLMAGASARSITPTEYETYSDLNGDATYQPGDEPFNDAGVDHHFDVEERGAVGSDGKPGKAGVDDDGNGTADDASEYLAAGSDDLEDPVGDNYDPSTNPLGTEGNGIFESVALAGFQGLLGQDIRPMQGVHDEIWTRAVAVSSGDESFILIVDDLIGLLYHYMNPVKRDLERDLGIPFDHIIIASTHTHHGPDTVGLWAGSVNEKYMHALMDNMYRVAVEAWEHRESVKLRSSTIQPSACYDRATGVPMPLADCYLGDTEAANLENGAAYDQYMLQNDLRDPWVQRMEVSAMRFEATDGRTVASLINFDDHPEVFLDENPLCSSDFPNYVRETVENALGGTAIYISGTVGSQMSALRGAPIPYHDVQGNTHYQPGVFDAEGNPVPVWAEGAENRVRSLGMEIGEYAIEALASAPISQNPVLSLQTEYIDISIENPLYRLLMRAIRNNPDFHEQEYMVHERYCSSAGCVRLPMSVFSLGDATFVTAPGEFPPEYVVGREASIAPYSETNPPWEDYAFPALPGIRSAVKTRDLFWVGLANMYLGYAIPKSDTLSFTNTEHPNYYEEIYDPNLCFGDSVGNRLMEMLGSAERFGDCVAYPEASIRPQKGSRSASHRHR